MKCGNIGKILDDWGQDSSLKDFGSPRAAELSPYLSSPSNINLKNIFLSPMETYWRLTVLLAAKKPSMFEVVWKKQCRIRILTDGYVSILYIWGIFKVWWKREQLPPLWSGGGRREIISCKSHLQVGRNILCLSISTSQWLEEHRSCRARVGCYKLTTNSCIISTVRLYSSRNINKTD